MKYFKRANIYKNYSGDAIYHPETKEGFSYHWWQVCGVFKGKKVFNTYYYSNTTVKHQSAIRALFGSVDLEVKAPKGLKDKAAIIRFYINENKQLRRLINRPRTHKAKNQERAEMIKRNQGTLLEVRKWL